MIKITLAYLNHSQSAMNFFLSQFRIPRIKPILYKYNVITYLRVAQFLSLFLQCPHFPIGSTRRHIIPGQPRGMEKYIGTMFVIPYPHAANTCTSKCMLLNKTTRTISASPILQFWQWKLLVGGGGGALGPQNSMPCSSASKNALNHWISADWGLIFYHG